MCGGVAFAKLYVPARPARRTVLLRPIEGREPISERLGCQKLASLRITSRVCQVAQSVLASLGAKMLGSQ